jgi:uncharacterized protein YndB with AHSA1/START domain
MLAVVIPTVGFSADLPPVVTEGLVNASAGEIWRAWTTPDGMRSWLAPVADIDLRIDGLMRTNYNPNGKLEDDGTIENRILAFDPEHMFAIKVAKAPKSFPFPIAVQKMWTVVYFTEQGTGQTLVRAVGHGFTDDPESTRMREFFQKGNDFTLSELRKRFAK